MGAYLLFRSEAPLCLGTPSSLFGPLPALRCNLPPQLVDLCGPRFELILLRPGQCVGEEEEGRRRWLCGQHRKVRAGNFVAHVIFQQHHYAGKSTPCRYCSCGRKARTTVVVFWLTNCMVPMSPLRFEVLWCTLFAKIHTLEQLKFLSLLSKTARQRVGAGTCGVDTHL